MVIKYEDVYFLGTKFNVVYSHIFMLILYRLCKKSNHLLSNVLLYCACIWSILIAIMVDCMTGLIGIVIFIIMDILFKKKPKSITSPWKYLILIAFSALFVSPFDVWFSAGPIFSVFLCPELFDWLVSREHFLNNPDRLKAAPV